jgi:hypothetical protein
MTDDSRRRTPHTPDQEPPRELRHRDRVMGRAACAATTGPSFPSAAGPACRGRRSVTPSASGCLSSRRWLGARHRHFATPSIDKYSGSLPWSSFRPPFARSTRPPRPPARSQPWSPRGQAPGVAPTFRRTVRVSLVLCFRSAIEEARARLPDAARQELSRCLDFFYTRLIVMYGLLRSIEIFDRSLKNLGRGTRQRPAAEVGYCHARRLRGTLAGLRVFFAGPIRRH